MPIKDGVGEGPATHRKLRDFQKIIEMHLKITHAVIGRTSAPRIYRYIDLTAGKGFALNPPQHGCAALFVDAIERIFHDKLRYRADFIDGDEECVESLQSWLGPLADQYHCDKSQWWFHTGEYQDIGPQVARLNPNHAYGIVFVDPNGDAPDIETLAAIADIRPRMEILMYVATTNLKRAPEAPLFADYFERIHKKNWLIREKLQGDPLGWTFVLGSNAADLFDNYKSIGFYKVTDPRVQQSFQMFSKTKEELRDELQGRLFD